MTILMNDLEMSQELDRETMAATLGGTSRRARRRPSRRNPHSYGHVKAEVGRDGIASVGNGNTNQNFSGNDLDVDLSKIHVQKGSTFEVFIGNSA